MNNFITTFVIVLIAVLSITVSSNLSTFARTSTYLKEDIEVAVHDASLEIDNEALSSGNIVFIEDKARNTFRESLEINANLSSDDYEIVEFHVFDHSNSTFPVVFESAKVDFKDTFIYPSILAIIKTKTNQYFNIEQEKDVTRIASYSYRLDENSMSSFNHSLAFVPSEANDKGFHWVVPHTQNKTSSFGYRIHPIEGVPKLHNGMDIASAGILNMPTVSALDGTVTYAGHMGGYGNLVEVKHDNGLVTRYAHLNAIHVEKGQNVMGGQILGLIGSTGVSTGAHLHFETIYKGKHVDPNIFY